MKCVCNDKTCFPSLKILGQIARNILAGLPPVVKKEKAVAWAAANPEVLKRAAAVTEMLIDQETMESLCSGCKDRIISVVWGHKKNHSAAAILDAALVDASREHGTLERLKGPRSSSQYVRLQPLDATAMHAARVEAKEASHVDDTKDDDDNDDENKSFSSRRRATLLDAASSESEEERGESVFGVFSSQPKEEHSSVESASSLKSSDKTNETKVAAVRVSAQLRNCEPFAEDDLRKMTFEGLKILLLNGEITKEEEIKKVQAALFKTSDERSRLGLGLARRLSSAKLESEVTEARHVILFGWAPDWTGAPASIRERLRQVCEDLPNGSTVSCFNMEPSDLFHKLMVTVSDDRSVGGIAHSKDVIAAGEGDYFDGWELRCEDRSVRCDDRSQKKYTIKHYHGDCGKRISFLE